MTARTGLVVVAGLAVLLVAACAPVPVRAPGTASQLAAQASREQRLAAEPDWSLEARFGASDGRSGGSGSLDWQQQGEQFRFTLRAPVTGKTVELQGGPGGVVLRGVGHGPLTGPDADAVLKQEFGWDVPVRDLAWWVRGLRSPGQPAALTFGANGLPATLDQDGWHVEYRDWYEDHVPPLPRKVFASRDPYSVRLMVQKWDGAE